MLVFAGLLVPHAMILELGSRHTVCRENQGLYRTHPLVHFWYLCLFESELSLTNLPLIYLFLSFLQVQTSMSQHF